MPDHPHIAALRVKLARAIDAARCVEFADDFAATNGAMAAAHRVVRHCQDELIRALAAQIEADCEAAAANLRHIETYARDAIAHGAA